MNQNKETIEIIAELVAHDPAGRTGLAARLKVSETTVARWLTKATKPQPAKERLIRHIAEQNMLQKDLIAPHQYMIDSMHEQASEQALRDKIHATLIAIRETIYRNGRLSSRQEVLDEASKLIFAHVISMANSGAGITPALRMSAKTPAIALKEFVGQQFGNYIPQSLAHDLSLSDFEFRIKDFETSYAEEILDCFHRLDRESLSYAISTMNGADILNEVFGQFMADSFVDEKELGQYLTPIEVVRYMARAGIASIPKETYFQLIDPIECANAGFILDPSCGVGSFLAETLRILNHQVTLRHGIEQASVWLRRMLEHNIVGIDKSERMIRLSLTSLSLFGADIANLYLANSLAREGTEGMRMADLEGKVALILTNPPFGASFSTSDLKQYEIATSWCRRLPSAIDSELLFMERYTRWLKPGGVFLSVVPDSILTNMGLFQDLRDGLSSSMSLESVVSLPPVTFGSAGTTTKTSILHMKKNDGIVTETKAQVYFAICNDIGFSVETRSSQKKKVDQGSNELVLLLPEALKQKEPKHGRVLNIPIESSRWDATYHIGLTSDISKTILVKSSTSILIKDVAELSDLRINPVRLFDKGVFSYIEISDVNPTSLEVSAKEISCENAPSRARKLVHSGDVLVSTVRPERKTIGVVPDWLDGAICSTGFAVLRCFAIDPTLLALVLQSDIVNKQILRHNVGIAYPAIKEECLLDVVLPVSQDALQEFKDKARSIRISRDNLANEERMLRKRICSLTTDWLLAS